MTRKCSHCSNNGHNSRTCPNRGVKLFGVRLTDGSIRKSASMGNLSLLAGSSSGAASPADGIDAGASAAVDGYASEDFAPGSSSSCREKKRGTPWTEEEHRMFLLGLKKLGKGDWRGISRNYVISRTPTQVASHAQKYFIRQTNFSRRKRRSSLFDMVPNEPLESQSLPMNCEEPAAPSSNPLPMPPMLDEECESMDSNNAAIGEVDTLQQETLQCTYPVIIPAYFSPFMQFSYPYWPLYKPEVLEHQEHEIVKPTPVHSKTPLNVDELLGMSKLSIGESVREAASSSTSLHLLGTANRQSAFHANLPTNKEESL